MLTRRALAFVIVHNLFETLNSGSLLVMLLLIANVAYHPLQIFGPETNNTIAGLPIQQFAICQLVIDVMRTCSFDLSNPIAEQNCRRNRDRNVNMSFGAIDFVED